MTKMIRYTINDVLKNRFYQLPKFLFEGKCTKLTSDARILYALLRDRHDLSLANQWVNMNNEIYLIFARKNIEKIMGLTDKTVKKTIEQLKDFGLVEEERMGLNRPNRIYLTSVSIENSGVGNFTNPESENLRLQSRKIYDSIDVNLTSQEPYNLRSNDTDFNKTNHNKTEIQSINQRTGTIDLVSQKIPSVDTKVIFNEIKGNGGIAYSYRLDKPKLIAAIHLLTNWSQFSVNGYHDEAKQEIYKLFVECLIEMAYADNVEQYKGSTVTYAKVIDMINQNIDWSYDSMTIFSFVDAFVAEFSEISKQQEIKALIPYMKSCIWNYFLTYRVKLHMATNY